MRLAYEGEPVLRGKWRPRAVNSKISQARKDWHATYQATQTALDTMCLEASMSSNCILHCLLHKALTIIGGTMALGLCRRGRSAG